MHPRIPPQGIFAPHPIPSREGSQGQAQPPAQALPQGQPSWVPPSLLPPVADGSDITPYHPYFIFSRVFLACPTLAEEALGREQALPRTGLAVQTKQQPQPHCVPLSAAHFHLLCSHEQLRRFHWIYLQQSRSMGRGNESCFGSPRACTAPGPRLGSRGQDTIAGRFVLSGGERHQQHNWSSEGARAPLQPSPIAHGTAASLSFGPKPLPTLPKAAA